MQRTLIASSILGFLLLGLGACSSAKTATRQEVSSAPSGLEQAGTTDVDKDGKQAPDLEELARKATMAATRLEVANMELAAFTKKQAARVGHAQAEVELAKAKLANFVEVEGPNSLAQQELSFQSAQESAAEAAEELAQLEIMYAEQDLNDLTREFVIARGKRRAERAQARIAIQASTLESFKQHELPTKRRRIELEVEKAVEALEQAKLEGEIEHIRKTLSIQEAEAKARKAQKELDEAKAEAA